MAVVRKGTIGSISGKVGSVIAYQLNGRDIVRSIPEKRTKKVSPKEQANRDKFALMQAWLKPLTAYLRMGFKNYAPTFQGFVAAKSYNSKHAFRQNEDGGYFIDPSLALVSYGPLVLPQTMAMERNGDEIVITWSTEDNHNGFETAMILAYIPATGKLKAGLAVAKRLEGRAVIAMPSASKKHEVHVYLTFFAYDHSSQTNSHYLGMMLS